MSAVALKMTIDQADALVSLVDLAVRMNMCQFGELEYWARTGLIKHRDGRELSLGELDSLESAMHQVSGIFGFASNASFGIGSPQVSKYAHRGYEVKKVLEKALAEFRAPNHMGLRGVNYDGLIVRYTDDTAPVATVDTAPSKSDKQEDGGRGRE